MPKTLAALPSSQYATVLSLTLGKLDFALDAPSSTAFTTAEPEADLLKMLGIAVFVLENEADELSLLAICVKGDTARFLRKADFVA